MCVLLQKKNEQKLYSILFVLCRMSDKTFSSIIKGKQDQLDKKIDVEYGLLRKLEACDVITTAHRKAIEVNLVTVYEF